MNLLRDLRFDFVLVYDPVDELVHHVTTAFHAHGLDPFDGECRVPNAPARVDGERTVGGERLET